MPFIGSQNAIFQLNMLKRTTVTVVYVRWPQNTSVSGFCGLRQTQDLKLKCFGVTSQKLL